MRRVNRNEFGFGFARIFALAGEKRIQLQIFCVLGLGLLMKIARGDVTVAIRHLIHMIQTSDPSTRQMLEALHEMGRSKIAFEHLAKKQKLNAKARVAFRAMWTVCGHRIRRALDDDGLFLDALWQMLPVYAGGTMRLYRGETWADFSSQRHGMSWSSDIETGRRFAQGRNALAPYGGGALLETIAPPEAIISGLSGGGGVAAEEFEYVVDRRRLVDIRLLENFPQV